MKRILLIDDDMDDMELFREALEEVQPFLLFEYADSVEAAFKELKEETDTCPNLIFLDINMPMVSGWEFLKEMRQYDHLSRVPVIIYSTSSQPKEKEKAAELGAIGFITKPSDYNALKAVLEKLLGDPKHWPNI